MKEKILSQDNKNLGNNLAKMRLMNNLTQDDLTQKLNFEGLNISRVTLSKIELGRRQVYAVELPYFCRAFKKGCSEFFDRLYK